MLACGGRGPCCHVGYAHRHCGHCDVVIPLHQYYQPFPTYPYWYGTLGGIRYGSQFSQFSQALTSGSVINATAHVHEEAN